MIKESIKKILNQTAKQEGLEREYDNNSYYKWRALANKWLKNSKTYNNFKTYLFFMQLLVSGSSVVVAVLVQEVKTTYIAISVWVLYAAINIFVTLVYRFYPDDYENLAKEVKEIKLIALSERLAAKLALFERLNEHDVIDNREIIDQISYRVKDYSEMDQEIKSVIEQCINLKARFTSSRDTNVTLPIEDYDLSDDEKVRLNYITKEISETAEVLFGGKGYSAKLYLRVIKTYCEEQVEILAPFSRFPTKENFGSSWIKSRGNLSSVWECLERGEDKVVDFSGHDLYYKSVLTICLPGRIGVIAIQNEEADIFKDNVSDLDCKALSLATKHMTMKAFEIND